MHQHTEALKRSDIQGKSTHLRNRQAVCEECRGRGMEIKIELFPSHCVPLVERVFEDNWGEKMLRNDVKSLPHSDNKSRHGKPIQEGWRVSPRSDVRAPLAPLYHDGVLAALLSENNRMVTLLTQPRATNECDAFT